MPVSSAQARPAPQRRSTPRESHRDEDLTNKALEIDRRLCRSFDCPIAYFHSLDPVSELVSSLLSHRTRNADSGRAFKALRARWPSWEQVAEADPAEIEETIRGVTWPELKAPRIRAVLHAILERQGSLSLDLLAEMEVDEARHWLETIPGIGPKTSAAVLSFSNLRMPALPVDSHHHRVAQRTGLIGQRVDVGPSHDILRAQLPDDWSAQKLYDNHEVLMLHGQHVCHYRNPTCGDCVLLDLCPTGQARTAAKG
ncbi:endonuclease III domain-containing protein [Methylobacterium gnaphalii]|uniref:Endonuclease III n=1 Tax=Methylobacterium gnaphalii TaxID=1010610 RepID=A0A512JGB7_9HYPH|nr:Fe-S cluster assembly protein HesB [Methylobacterium gnaphalii]GEP08932.1 endonuclease III [Methylobacterium gnaphalii]GJD70973.1 Ultraviolet N-glycosylase/AP lyase [Methylobacterium gnaphalii]GLS50423.1 endonuclease III [Methylobacterium gnaphalii]